jgi:hypothetical protein
MTQHSTSTQTVGGLLIDCRIKVVGSLPANDESTVCHTRQRPSAPCVVDAFMLKRTGGETFVLGEASIGGWTFLLQRTTVGWWRDILYMLERATIGGRRDILAGEGHYWPVKRHLCWRGLLLTDRHLCFRRPLLANRDTFMLERASAGWWRDIYAGEGYF